MTAADSISAEDRDLMRRLTLVLLFLFAFTAAFSGLDRVYSQKFLDVTGRAQWIWARQPMSANDPVAFFAARQFTLPEKRVYARLKVIGDPEYTLYVNGREVAGRRLESDRRELDLYDISELVHTGANRVVIALRAPLGVGGLLASLDIAPETENWIVSDGNWRIYRRWHPEILVRDIDDDWESPATFGEPPIGRWNYLPLARRALDAPPSKTLAAREAFPVIGFIPRIRTRSGIAVAVPDRVRATAFDFGFTKGRVRLTVASDGFASRAFNVRYANIRPELGLIDWSFRPVVFAPGEHTVTTPDVHNFRYVMVFGKNVGAEVVQ
jgi:hypothetical protein